MLEVMENPALIEFDTGKGIVRLEMEAKEAEDFMNKIEMAKAADIPVFFEFNHDEQGAIVGVKLEYERRPEDTV
jgi:hypothetical protein